MSKERDDDDPALFAGKRGRYTPGGIRALLNQIGDRAILKRWELCELSSYGAMLRMKKNNGWPDELTIHGFEELANSLGYWQPGKLPQWARIWDDQQFEI